jgi:hypothetical protein
MQAMLQQLDCSITLKMVLQKFGDEHFKWLSIDMLDGRTSTGEKLMIERVCVCVGGTWLG